MSATTEHLKYGEVQRSSRQSSWQRLFSSVDRRQCRHRRRKSRSLTALLDPSAAFDIWSTTAHCCNVWFWCSWTLMVFIVFIRSTASCASIISAVTHYSSIRRSSRVCSVANPVHHVHSTNNEVHRTSQSLSTSLRSWHARSCPLLALRNRWPCGPCHSMYKWHPELDAIQQTPAQCRQDSSGIQLFQITSIKVRS